MHSKSATIQGRILQHIREVLSFPSISWQLCIVGVIAGVIAACVIVAFRWVLVAWHSLMFGDFANYAAIDAIYRMLLPITAVACILLVAALTRFKHYRMGIPFVIHRLKVYYGHIPIKSSINQFFGGILALGSGFVVGKEGPTVHLAAATGHYIGRWLRLPFNALRVIAGCGIAAGIAAAFNTPFAAVIFVMEVVMRDYKIHIFLPIMLAAACGSLVTRLVYGNVYELSFLEFNHVSGIEQLYLVGFGILIGCMAALFNYQLMFIMRVFKPLNMFIRLSIAAVITGAVGYIYPQALGADFINVEKLFSMDSSWMNLLLLFIAKFYLACIAIALGVPGGIIGAVMVIGMLLGVVLIQPLTDVIDISSLTTYALLGLAGFLASVLLAPMAALSAAMELSGDSQVIMPAIIVIVSACITSRQFFASRSIFIQQLDFQQLPYTTSAVRDWLQQTGVLAILNRDFYILCNQSDDALTEFLHAHHNSIVIHQVKTDDACSTQYDWVSLNVSLNVDDHVLSKQPVNILTQQHTLADVHDALQSKRQGASVIIEKMLSNEQQYVSIDELNLQTHHMDDLTKCHVRGVITWNMLHGYLLKKRH